MPTTHTSTLALALPVNDWQFWVVTAVFLVAAGWVLFAVLPIRILTKGRRSGKRARLTIDGKPPPRG